VESAAFTPTLFRLEFVPLSYLPPGAGLDLLPVVESVPLHTYLIQA
jgi:hypothetical protein